MPYPLLPKDNNLYLSLKEAVMAKNDAKESAWLRTLRIDGSQNGATLRTRVVRDKTKYTRTLNDTATTEIYTLSLHDALPSPTRGISLL